jgi:(E)-4-hydroxy-3-methyl-but-2-enyl pyrophosphate reductase
MSVKLAGTAGFCMGVKRAVEIVLEMARRREREDIYTYGPLIHNPQTVALLEKRGVRPVADLGEVEHLPAGATLVLRAHGVSPGERACIRAHGMRIVDATCPKVGRVQAIIRKHARQGHLIVIVGDRDHPEVNGLLGYAGSRGAVIGSAAEIAGLPAAEKVCVVAQTTQSADDYALIAGELRRRFPGAVVFDTICDSTEKRQAEVRQLAAEMDAVVIVGGANSANTRRLAALAERRGTPTFRIETQDELGALPIAAFDRIGVSAGASTPNWIIDRVVDAILAGQGGRPAWHHRFYRLWAAAVRTEVHSALGAGCLCLAGTLLQGLPVDASSIATACLYVYAMHILNRFLDRKASSLIGSFREDSYRRHEGAFITTALVSLIAALILTAWHGAGPFLLLLAVSVAGILYNAPLRAAGKRFRRLKDVPGSKNLSMALAWAVVTSLLPWVEFGPVLFAPAVAVAFLFTFGTVFVRSAMSDTLDVQSDRFLGRETIPVLIGEEKTRRLLIGVSAAQFALMALAYPFGWLNSLSIFLLSPIIYVWLCFRMCGRRRTFSGVVREGLWETTYIVAGVGALLWLVLQAWT